MSELEQVFSPQGPLAEKIPGYTPRPAQLEMAQAVEAAITDTRHLVAEAGTGTGKTLAYLVPAILSGQRVLISTGTRNLQDQLFKKDIPLVREVLTVPFQVAVLKGRANYLCRYRLRNSLESGGGFSKTDAVAINRIQRWSEKTRLGDISEVSSVSEDSSVWPMVTSTGDNCLGQDCPDYQDCFLVRSRRRAQESEILIINHYLLCADWTLRDTGFGELLPDVDVVIVDEAHQLYDIASRFLGGSVSARQMHNLAGDVLVEYTRDALDMRDLKTRADQLVKVVNDARLAFGESIQRGPWRDIETRPPVQAALAKIVQALNALAEILCEAAPRSKGLESCERRCGEIEQNLKQLLGATDREWIRWYETHRKTFTLNRTPFEIAGEFQRLVAERGATWIYTSATLTVSGGFDHFLNTLGLGDVDTRIWDSPFDYPNQALFFHPRGLADPASQGYTDEVADLCREIIRASGGRAFLLFTSHRALRLAADRLEDGVEYPLLVQGTRPRGVLIDEFRRQGNAVLLGTSSFWEGVDVRGDALSVVIIDKLPFTSPADPVVRARMDSLQRQGQNPFETYQLPMAAITLKQGVGRLIRDDTDRGVFVLCDPRLLKRSYGRVFLDSLPPMRRTRDIADVCSFFRPSA